MKLNDRDAKSALAYMLGYAASGKVTFDNVIMKLHGKLSFGDCAGDVKYDYKK